MRNRPPLSFNGKVLLTRNEVSRLGVRFSPILPLSVDGTAKATARTLRQAVQLITSDNTHLSEATADVFEPPSTKQVCP
jgi:hypothetical protein